jgi:hypothetical protein
MTGLIKNQAMLTDRKNKTKHFFQNSGKSYPQYPQPVAPGCYWPAAADGTQK